MIDRDSTWRALCQPRATTEYGFAELAEPCAPGSRFHPVIAGLASEMARLAYQDDESVRASALARGAAWRFREIGLVESGPNACLVVVADAVPLTIVAFRGTDDPRDWRTNLQALLSRWKPGGFAHRGFKHAWYAIAPLLGEKLHGLPRPRLVCGHSLGGALAVLEASQRGCDALYTFGAPRVGTASLYATLRGVAAYRVVNHHDPVAELPTAGPPFFFDHGGQRVQLAANGGIDDSAPTFGDRARAFLDVLKNRDAWKNLAANAPPPLPDHAPVNYSAKLLRLTAR